MEQVDEVLAQREFQRACGALEQGDVLRALGWLESALRRHDNPQWHAMLGYCIAKERGHVGRGMELCRTALERYPEQPESYYFMARVLALSGKKAEAVELLRQGLSCGDSLAIKRYLQELGVRKPPFIGWLPRDNPFNKYCGLVLARLGLR